MSTCAAGFDDHVDADSALAFVDNALTERERGVLERRIDACGECRGVIAEAARGRTGQATKLEKPAAIAAPARPSQPALVAGEVVGRYIVERPLGAGGMGVVSLARDPELRRAVVIKLVRPDAADIDLEARLRREAQAMAQLSHTHVVQIFDIGRHGDRVFLAMEFIAGQTLDAWLIEKPRTTGEILAMFLQAGAGLEAAHRAGLLHRDFKPTNVLVDRDGAAKVTDFGLARALATPAASAPMPRVSGVHAVLTHHDEVIGTPAYMAPEQLHGQPLDARTDEYALALALLDALVDQPPTRRRVGPASTPAEIEAALEHVSPRIRSAIARALRADPDERFPDLRGFLAELAPPKKRQRWWPALAGLALCAAAVSTWLAMHRSTAATCTAKTTWDPAPVRAALTAQPRAFAAWHAEHVIVAIEKAVGGIGALEIAACEGKSVDAACLDRRRAALATRFDVTAPWAYVHAVASCTDQPAPEAAPTTRADELEVAARAAIDRGDFDAAAEAFVGEASAGDVAGDDSLRGRALLGQLDLARIRGNLLVARDTAKQLAAIVERHGNEPRDVYAVAIASADAFGELGDVAQTFAAIERAAATAKSPAEIAAVHARRARALQEMRADPEGAKRELAQVGPNEIAGDLALARGEPTTIFDGDTTLLGRLRAARATALAGHVDQALAALDAITGNDLTTRSRVRIARAHIYYAAKRYADADVEVVHMFQEVSEASYTDPPTRSALTAAEKIDAWLLRCDAELELPGERRWCTHPSFLETEDPKSPLLARARLQDAREYDLDGKTNTVPLGQAIEIFAANGAEPVYLATLRLRFVRMDENAYQRKEQATLARAAFAAAGRTAEVAELDAILGPKASPPPDEPDDSPPLDAAPKLDAPSGDPWAP